MKKIFIAFVIATAALLLVIYGPVFAANEAGVSVTVKAKNISISVSPTSYDYGVLALSTTTETTSTFTATNNGNVTENFFLRGADTTNWTLAATPGADQYRHDWKKGLMGAYAALTTSNQAAGGPVAAGSSLAGYRFQIYMPTTSASFDAQSPSVTFVATE